MLLKNVAEVILTIFESKLKTWEEFRRTIKNQKQFLQQLEYFNKNDPRILQIVLKKIKKMSTDNSWENQENINYDSINKKSCCMAKLSLWVNHWIN